MTAFEFWKFPKLLSWSSHWKLPENYWKSIGIFFCHTQSKSWFVFLSELPIISKADSRSYEKTFLDMLVFSIRTFQRGAQTAAPSCYTCYSGKCYQLVNTLLSRLVCTYFWQLIIRIKFYDWKCYSLGQYYGLSLANCDSMLPLSACRGQSKGEGSYSCSLSPWSSASSKLPPPVRLSRISSVLPYDELRASYGDLKLSKDGEKQGEKIKKKHNSLVRQIY